MFAQQACRKAACRFGRLRAWDDMSRQKSAKSCRAAVRILLPDASLRSAIWTLKRKGGCFRVVPQRYKIFYTSTAERDITEKLMYIMQQYRYGFGRTVTTPLHFAQENLTAFRLSIRYMT